MGDMLSLIEKAESEFDEKEAKKLEKKLKKREFDLEDFQDQLKNMKKTGIHGTNSWYVARHGTAKAIKEIETG
jgi:signal recognition particle subunit SRP54